MPGYTILVFDDHLPRSSWRSIVIDGVCYKPIPVMDAGENCIAIEGVHELDGKEAQFAAS